MLPSKSCHIKKKQGETAINNRHYFSKLLREFSCTRCKLYNLAVYLKRRENYSPTQNFLSSLS